MRQIELICQDDERIQRCALEEKGIRFIFLPVPNKETIHFEYLKTNKPDFLRTLGPETTENSMLKLLIHKQHLMRLIKKRSMLLIT